MWNCYSCNLYLLLLNSTHSVRETSPSANEIFSKKKRVTFSSVLLFFLLMFYFTGCKNDPTQKGIIPKSFEQIFSDISRSSNVQYLVRASYLEIYQEEIR
jgi:hypothetical protein